MCLHVMKVLGYVEARITKARCCSVSPYLSQGFGQPVMFIDEHTLSPTGGGSMQYSVMECVHEQLLQLAGHVYVVIRSNDNVYE